MYEKPLIPQEAIARGRPLGRVPFGFGPRFFVALVLGLVWLVPAWWFSRFIYAMLLWDLLFFAVWTWDLLRLPAPDQLEMRRVWSLRPTLAVPSYVKIAVRNFGRVSVHARIVDETPAALQLTPAEVELDVPAGASAESQYPILPSQRGDANLNRIFVRYQSALRIAERWAVANAPQTVTVFPNLDEAKQHTLYLIRSRQVELEKRRRRQRGQGREFDSLREYREGDELRDISWTATARRNHLVTRVFQIERSQAVWIVLDAGRLLRAKVAEPGRIAISKLDYAANAALSLAQIAMHSGDRVGLLAYGRNIQQNLNAARGPHQMRAIVEALAHIRGEAGEADHGRAVHILLSEQKRRSLIVWITDFAETATTPEVLEFAMHMANRHLIVFAAMGQPDLNALAAATPETTEDMYRHVAALEIADRRSALLGALRQRGVLVLELMPGMLASSLVNQYMDVKERGLL
jgi:uncharacterized protein (DUF58 family)